MSCAPFSAYVVVVLALAVSGCKRSQSVTAESQELFASACARCHGKDGSGGLPIWEGGPSPKDFRDHEFQASHTDEQIKQTIRNGKPPGMPPFGATFDEAQLAALVAQVRSFDARAK